MKPNHDVGSLLAVLGVCACIGGGCGGKNSSGGQDATGGAVASGGTLGGGGTLGSGGSRATGGSGGISKADASPTDVGGGGVVGSGGTVGSGGSRATGGSGGISKADASPTDVGSGGACGRAGATCGEGQFCDLASKCGTVADAEGSCTATGPTVSCTREYRPVCGCDLVSYANDCLRRAAGVLKLQEGLCAGPPDGSMGGQSGSGGTLGAGGTLGSGGVSGSGGGTGTAPAVTYTGCFRVASLDRITLQRRDLVQDQCLVLQLADGGSGRAGYAVALPAGWVLVSALISPCTGTGTAVTATSATGTIAWGAGASYPPQTVTVDVVLGVNVLDGGPTASYVFSARDIDLSSGC